MNNFLIYQGRVYIELTWITQWISSDFLQSIYELFFNSLFKWNCMIINHIFTLFIEVNFAAFLKMILAQGQAISYQRFNSEFFIYSDFSLSSHITLFFHLCIILKASDKLWNLYFYLFIYFSRNHIFYVDSHRLSVD